MRVEMYHRDRSVYWIDWSQQWQNNSMVTTKGNNSRMNFAVKRNWKKLLPSDRIITQGGICFTVKQTLVTVLNLLDCQFIVVWTGRLRVMRLGGGEHYERTYVTGMSPQSTILRPELKGLTSRGTLYPPHRVKRRDPARIPAIVKTLGWCQSSG